MFLLFALGVSDPASGPSAPIFCKTSTLHPGRSPTDTAVRPSAQYHLRVSRCTSIHPLHPRLPPAVSPRPKSDATLPPPAPTLLSSPLTVTAGRLLLLRRIRPLSLRRQLGLLQIHGEHIQPVRIASAGSDGRDWPSPLCPYVATSPPRCRCSRPIDLPISLFPHRVGGRTSHYTTSLALPLPCPRSISRGRRTIRIQDCFLTPLSRRHRTDDRRHRSRRARRRAHARSAPRGRRPGQRRLSGAGTVHRDVHDGGTDPLGAHARCW